MMAGKRLYMCQNCSMIYWGHELLPGAKLFPKALKVNCPTPGCGGWWLFGQATPGEMSLRKGTFPAFLAFIVLLWFVKLDFLSAVGGAFAVGIAVILFYYRKYQPGSAYEDQTHGADKLLAQGEKLQQANRFQEAKFSYKRAAVILGEGVDLELEGAIIGRLATVEKALGDFMSARSHYEIALAIAEKLGDISGIINRLNNLAALLGDDLHNPIEAIPYIERAVNLARDFGDPVKFSQMLYHLAESEREAGYFDGARNHVNEAIAVAKSTGQAEILAEALYKRACLAVSEGHNADAISDLKNGLDALGPGPADDSTDVAKWTPNPTQIFNRRDKHSLRKALQSTLKVVEAAIQTNTSVQILPPGHVGMGKEESKFIADIAPEALEALRHGMDHAAAGRLNLAVDSLTQAIQQDCIRNSPRAQALAEMNLGNILRELGRVDKSLEVLRNAENRVREAGDLRIECGVLLNLGIVLNVKGLWAESRKYLERALVLAEQNGNQSTQGRILLALGNLYRDSRELKLAIEKYTQAESLAQICADVELQAAISQSCGNLYFNQRRWRDAQPHYEKALKLARQIRDSRLQGIALHMLGNIYRRLGELQPAFETLQQSVFLADACPSEVGLAGRFNDLAIVEHDLGRLEDAKDHYQQTIQIYRKHGIVNPDVAGCLENFGVLLVRLGDILTGRDHILNASLIDTKMITEAFAIASENARLEFVLKAQSRLNDLISLVARGGPLEGNLSMVRACADIVIRRKGITLEAVAIQRDIVASGSHPELASMFQELKNVRMEMAQLILKGEGLEEKGAFTPNVASLAERKRRIEQQITQYFPQVAFDQQLGHADCETVSRKLPEGCVLVEFLRFNFFDFSSAKQRIDRYAAFVLPAGEPDKVRMIDLGEADPIDEMIIEAFLSYANPNQSFDKGFKLRAAIFDPLLVAIKDRKRLLLAPDSALTLLPFELLPTDNDHCLIDDFRISYLTVARDVLRFGTEFMVASNEAVVIADPDFDLAEGEAAYHQKNFETQTKQSRHLDLFIKEPLPRLPGTRFEGEKIATMLGVRPWLGSAVLESQIKAIRSPHILHIATHGVFLRDQDHDSNRTHLGIVEVVEGDELSQLSCQMENSLLCSGLALAGANWKKKGFKPHPKAEDGILTALDVTGLDLINTELVVLSACETASGAVLAGEGVFGLRRAFALAGAKTLVMSLWKVHDLATAILMERFYCLLKHGLARDESLRKAQFYARDVTVGKIRDEWLSKEMIERLSAGNNDAKKELEEIAQQPDNHCPFSKPFYWGAFICQGDSGPLPQHLYGTKQ